MSDTLREVLASRARETLPLSDTEILTIYHEAKAKERAKVEPALDRWSLATVDAVLYAAIPAIIAATGTLTILQAGGIAAALLVLALGLAAVRVPPGVVSYSNKAAFGKKADAKDIDPHSVEVLDVVVQEFADTPVRYFDELSARLKQNLEQIKESLEALPKLERNLLREAETMQQQSVRDLLKRRAESAAEVRRKLTGIKENLERQMEEAVAAVEPVKEVREKFDRIRSLGESLEEIQSAHRLAFEAEGEMIEREHELQVLRALSFKAVVRLKEIENVLDSNQRARAELEVVTRAVPEAEKVETKTVHTE